MDIGLVKISKIKSSIFPSDLILQKIFIDMEYVSKFLVTKRTFLIFWLQVEKVNLRHFHHSFMIWSNMMQTEPTEPSFGQVITSIPLRPM